jgi:hypothetical protein
MPVIDPGRRHHPIRQPLRLPRALRVSSPRRPAALCRHSWPSSRLPLSRHRARCRRNCSRSRLPLARSPRARRSRLRWPRTRRLLRRRRTTPFDREPGRARPPKAKLARGSSTRPRPMLVARRPTAPRCTPRPVDRARRTSRSLSGRRGSFGGRRQSLSLRLARCRRPSTHRRQLRPKRRLPIGRKRARGRRRWFLILWLEPRRHPSARRCTSRRGVRSQTLLLLAARPGAKAPPSSFPHRPRPRQAPTSRRFGRSSAHRLVSASRRVE